jgi:DNA-binding NtrC family response regulator
MNTMNDRPCKLIVVDDEILLRKSIIRSFRGKPFDILEAGNGREALELLRENPDTEVVLTDIQMPVMDGITLLKEIKILEPELEVVVLTAYPSIDIALESVRQGAFDFLTKPFESEKLEILLRNACEKHRLISRSRSLQQEVNSRYSFENIIGASEPMQDMFQLVRDLSSFESNILITGESGTGKELVAKAIHFNSPRSHHTMMTVNCSALTETLLDSELFGHVKGAFTGATGNKKGLFESADRGTLFLDEIGDISAATQVKILRAIEQGEVKPVGSNTVINVDVRIVAATNKNLEEMVEKDQFREDLYYRLNVLRIHLPPLRERREDIALLARHFVNKVCGKMNTEVMEIDDQVMEKLQNAPWKGNVRELENLIERSVILSRGGKMSMQVLDDFLKFAGKPKKTATEDIKLTELHGTYKEAKNKFVDTFHKRYCDYLLSKTKGNISAAAKIAGMDRSNFWKIVKSVGLEADNYKS